MLQRAALGSRENGLVEIKFLSRLLICQNHTAPWASQCLVGGGSHHICIRNGTGVFARCHQAGDMGHINHEISANFVSDFTKPLEINCPGIGAGACYDKLWPGFLCNPLQLIVVDEPLVVDSVRKNSQGFRGSDGRHGPGSCP